MDTGSSDLWVPDDTCSDLICGTTFITYSFQILLSNYFYVPNNAIIHHNHPLIRHNLANGRFSMVQVQPVDILQWIAFVLMKKIQKFAITIKYV